MKILSCEHGDCYERAGDDETTDVCVDCQFKRYHQRGGRLSATDFLFLMGKHGQLLELYAWLASVQDPKSFVEQLTYKAMCAMLEGMGITRMSIALRKGQYTVALVSRRMVSAPLYSGTDKNLLVAIDEALDEYIEEICNVNGLSTNQIRGSLFNAA